MDISTLINAVFLSVILATAGAIAKLYFMLSKLELQLVRIDERLKMLLGAPYETD